MGAQTSAKVASTRGAFVECSDSEWKGPKVFHQRARLPRPNPEALEQKGTSLEMGRASRSRGKRSDNAIKRMQNPMSPMFEARDCS